MTGGLSNAKAGRWGRHEVMSPRNRSKQDTGVTVDNDVVSGVTRTEAFEIAAVTTHAYDN